MTEAGISIKQEDKRLGVINVVLHIENLLVISHLISHIGYFDDKDDAALNLSSRAREAGR